MARAMPSHPQDLLALLPRIAGNSPSLGDPEIGTTTDRSGRSRTVSDALQDHPKPHRKPPLDPLKSADFGFSFELFFESYCGEKNCKPFKKNSLTTEKPGES
jgi:hypothetical protein